MMTPAPWSEETVELFQITCMIWQHHGDARFADLFGSERVRAEAASTMEQILGFEARHRAGQDARQRYLEQGETTRIP
jgi:hypothetical protein